MYSLICDVVGWPCAMAIVTVGPRRRVGRGAVVDSPVVGRAFKPELIETKQGPSRDLLRIGPPTLSMSKRVNHVRSSRSRPALGDGLRRRSFMLARTTGSLNCVGRMACPGRSRCGCRRGTCRGKADVVVVEDFHGDYRPVTIRAPKKSREPKIWAPQRGEFYAAWDALSEVSWGDGSGGWPFERRGSNPDRRFEWVPTSRPCSRSGAAHAGAPGRAAARREGAGASAIMGFSGEPGQLAVCHRSGACAALSRRSIARAPPRRRASASLRCAGVASRRKRAPKRETRAHVRGSPRR